MIYAFQDQDYLYLVMDLLTGGNLRYHLTRHKKFNEEQSSNIIQYIYIILVIEFFVACTLLGLEYLHSEKIIHRDIKPENLVLDENGYVHITDFGIAKRFKHNNGKDTSGTMGYMAPEVLKSESHGYSVDYYALGIVTYEFMFGHRPYLAKSKKELKELILTSQAHVGIEDIPLGWSDDAGDFINQLIQRKAKKRLGINSVNEVKMHPWLSEFEWKELSQMNLIAPFFPRRGDNFDKKYCSAPDRIGRDTLERYKQYALNSSYNDKFKNFSSEAIPNEFKVCFMQTKHKTNSNDNNNNKSELNSTSNMFPISGTSLPKSNSRNFKINSLQRHFNSTNCINRSLCNNSLHSINQKDLTKKSELFALNHRSNNNCLEKSGNQFKLKNPDNAFNIESNVLKYKKRQVSVIHKNQIHQNGASFVVRNASMDESIQSKQMNIAKLFKKDGQLKKSNSHKLIFSKPHQIENHKLPIINLSFSKKKSMLDSKNDFFPYHNNAHQQKHPKIHLRNKFLDFDGNNLKSFNKTNHMNKSMYCKAPLFANRRLTINKSIRNFNS